MNTQAMSKVKVFALFSLVLLMLAVVPATQAQFKSFNWENWDVDITLLENGDLAVTENQTLYFSGAPYTFGYRSIPTGSAGQNDGISNVSVRQGSDIFTESSSNAPGTFEVIDQGGETRINWYFEPAMGDQSYTFSYTVHGAVRTGTLEQGDGDQIFWTVIPNDHPAYVANSRNTITLPEGIAPQQYTGTNDYLVAAYINGVETKDVDISVSPDGRIITYELLRPLDTNEKLEIRVQFPHGPLPIETPGWQASAQRSDVYSLIVLALSVLMLIGGPLAVILLWYTRGRDPELGLVVPKYITEPPNDMPPAMVGTLVDERADMDDITSTVVDLARRGYLTMEQQKKKGFLFKRTDKPATGLRTYENTFLKKFFGSKEEVTLESMRYNFSANLPKLRSELYDVLVEEGYVPRSPNDVRTGYAVLAGAVLVLGIGALVLIGALFEGLAALSCLPMLAILATSATLFIASRHMPRKTEKGTVATAQWLAFKHYLKNIQDYADLSQASDMFEKYLAYAICFGLERNFISTFAGEPTTPMPTWYQPYPPIIMTGGPGSYGGGTMGGGPFGGGGASMPRPSLEGMSGNLTGGLAAMSVGLTQMLNSTNSVLQSTRPSSSGHGSSGGFSGGFSGGGGGGGGFSGGGGGSGGFG